MVLGFLPGVIGARPFALPGAAAATLPAATHIKPPSSSIGLPSLSPGDAQTTSYRQELQQLVALAHLQRQLARGTLPNGYDVPGTLMRLNPLSVLISIWSEKPEMASLVLRAQVAEAVLLQVAGAPKDDARTINQAIVVVEELSDLVIGALVALTVQRTAEGGPFVSPELRNHLAPLLQQPRHRHVKSLIDQAETYRIPLVMVPSGALPYVKAELDAPDVEFSEVDALSNPSPLCILIGKKDPPEVLRLFLNEIYGLALLRKTRKRTFELEAVSSLGEGTADNTKSLEDALDDLDARKPGGFVAWQVVSYVGAPLDKDQEVPTLLKQDQSRPLFGSQPLFPRDWLPGMDRALSNLSWLKAGFLHGLTLPRGRIIPQDALFQFLQDGQKALPGGTLLAPPKDFQALVETSFQTWEQMQRAHP